jgi:hypothetical protein
MPSGQFGSSGEFGASRLRARDLDLADQGVSDQPDLARIAPRRETAPCSTSRNDLFNGTPTGVGNVPTCCSQAPQLVE